MTEILFTDLLELGEEHLPVHLASDQQVYVLLKDLCDLVGLDVDGGMRQILDDVSIADLTAFMSPPGGIGDLNLTRPTAFMNLAALPYSLGLVRYEEMKYPERHTRLVRFTLEFSDVFWILYRALLHGRDPEQVRRSWLRATVAQ